MSAPATTKSANVRASNGGSATACAATRAVSVRLGNPASTSPVKMPPTPRRVGEERAEPEVRQLWGHRGVSGDGGDRDEEVLGEELAVGQRQGDEADREGQRAEELTGRVAPRDARGHDADRDVGTSHDTRGHRGRARSSQAERPVVHRAPERRSDPRARREPGLGDPAADCHTHLPCSSDATNPPSPVPWRWRGPRSRDARTTRVPVRSPQLGLRRPLRGRVATPLYSCADGRCGKAPPLFLRDGAGG